MLRLPLHGDAYSNSNDIRIDRLQSETRRFLIMIRAGGQARPVFFDSPIREARNFDVAMSYYGVPSRDDIAFRAADIIVAGGLSKFHGAKAFFEATGYHERYHGMMFVDEDVEVLL